MNIVLLGAGNVATSLALSFVSSGHCVLQVFSRTLRSAEQLSKKINAQPIDQLSKLDLSADLYLCSVKDDALLLTIRSLPSLNGIVVHTAGSMPKDIFEDSSIVRYGVFYPFQTFTKEIIITFQEVPLFIEGSDSGVVSVLEQLAQSMGAKYWHLSSDDRKWLHLAGVYACNFTNSFFVKAEEMLSKANVPFEAILPLIKETVRKVENNRPVDVQTGPAVREDYDVIEGQLKLIDHSEDREIYRRMTQQIIKQKKNK